MNLKNYIRGLGKTGMVYLGWGLACGSASLGFAMMAGLTGRPDLGAMSAGVLTWSVLCALLAGRAGFSEGMAKGAWGKAWRLGLWVRTGLTLTGAAFMGLGMVVPSASGWGEWIVTPDFIAGAISIALTRWVVGGFSTGGEGLPGGFLSIYLTTLVQGAWVVGSILVLTVIIRGLLRNEEKAVASQGGDPDAAHL